MSTTMQIGAGVDQSQARAIALHGAALGAPGLPNRRGLTDEQLAENDRACLAMGGVLGWGWADTMAEIIDRALDAEARQMKLAVELPRERWLRTRAAVRAYAEGRGLVMDGVLKRVGVANFFPLEERQPGLTIDHHLEAWASCRGSRDTARRWLGEAVRMRWSPRELRGAIRAKQRREPVAETEAESVVGLVDVELAADALARRIVSLGDSVNGDVLLAAVRRLIEVLKARCENFPD